MSDEGEPYRLKVTVNDEHIFVDGSAFHKLKELGIDINQIWLDGFSGTIEIKGDME